MVTRNIAIRILVATKAIGFTKSSVQQKVFEIENHSRTMEHLVNEKMTGQIVTEMRTFIASFYYIISL
jgi:hypothetical protein